MQHSQSSHPSNELIETQITPHPQRDQQHTRDKARSGKRDSQAVEKAGHRVYRLNAMTAPSTTAASVVAISSVWRLERDREKGHSTSGLPLVQEFQVNRFVIPMPFF